MIIRAVVLLLIVAACTPPMQRTETSATQSLAPAAPGAALQLPASSRRWVERTLTSLSLREKVAQLIMPWVGGDYTPVDSPEFDRLADWVEREKVGGLILSVGLPHSYAAKLNELQRRADVPLFITSDMENGTGMRLAGIYSLPHLLPQGGGTVFPPVMALGATGSDSLAYELGRVLGREARAVGVHMTFGPVLDVNSNPVNPIINTRSFGEDPALVARLGAAYIRGAREEGLMTTGKHFPGHGDTEVDSHIDLPTIRADRRRLDEVDLPPFRTAVEAGIDGIMTAHIAVVGVEGEGAPPATLSPYFMTEVLRDEMGFRGILFTDAMTMGGVAKRYGATEPLVMALEAGADILLMPRDVHQAIETVVAAVQSGRITEERIDASVRRLLEAKARAGLPQGRLVDLDAVDQIVGVRPHTEVARTVAERSITLVRDRTSLVPFGSTPRRVLSVTYAEGSDLIAGRVFNNTLAAGGAVLQPARVDDRTTATDYEALLASEDSADLVVVSAYVSPREEKGSVGVHGGFEAFVERLALAGKPVIVVSFGTPYLLDGFPSVPAYVLAWGGAEVSQRAAARALLGETPITGRLPISLPPHHALGDGIQRDARLTGGQE
jgi:beta-N-acetylhexosaminidase